MLYRWAFFSQNPKIVKKMPSSIPKEKVGFF